MNEQAIILFFLIAGTFLTIFLYVWKAKKEIEYKRDERWQFIQNKANNAANYLNYLLLLSIVILDVVLLTNDTQITLTLNRVISCVILFISLRNIIELIALKYFDKRM